MGNRFILKSTYQPCGDQPKAIKRLADGLASGQKFQTLLGVTGSGKTFTVANVIVKVQKPTLVIAHNKTLAAQLCNEFREFFPQNAVHYFVSYYDYYQPEAYIPTTDTYIGKETLVNEEIDRLRHEATQSLLTRKDVIVVASVSCIYNLGAPDVYRRVALNLNSNQTIMRNDLIRQLVDLGYARTSGDLKRNIFRARGEVVEIVPSAEEIIYRIELAGDKIKKIIALDNVTRKRKEELQNVLIFPVKHFVTLREDLDKSLKNIRAELNERIKFFEKQEKFLEAERISQRTRFDLEMIKEIGFCHGVENYSRHLSFRPAGAPPETLLSYFPKDFLMIIDESHVTVPQIRGMYEGDASRKKILIEYGFRLPSAADNRPLKFNEFEQRMPQTIFTSATPGDYEFKNSSQVAEQIIRPTGLVDPEVVVLPITANATERLGVNTASKSQVEDLVDRIKERINKKERILVTTLTKKMAENVADYLTDSGFKVTYLHSEVKALDRIKILSDFRRGKYDILVGVNLLREGLDLPEVSLVAILDADKEGFLRSETSLIQTIGRAARNVSGKVILYADEMTGSLKKAINETNRRRKIQTDYNKKHNITPKTIKKAIKDITEQLATTHPESRKILDLDTLGEKGKRVEEIIKEKEKQMQEAAKFLQFELAAILRDEIKILKSKLKNNYER